MTSYFIKLNQPERDQLNSILMYYVVDANGQTQPPFQAGTTEYLDDSLLYLVDDYIEQAANDSTFTQADRDFVNGLLALKKTYDEAVTAGWIIPIIL